MINFLNKRFCALSESIQQQFVLIINLGAGSRCSGNSGRFAWTLLASVVLPNTKSTIYSSILWSLRAVEFFLENSPLQHCNWVQSYSDRAKQTAWSSPLPLKKKKNDQSWVKQCILHLLRHKTRSLIIIGPDMDQTVCNHMPLGWSVGLRAIGTYNRQGFGENNSNLEKTNFGTAGPVLEEKELIITGWWINHQY